MTTLIDVRNRLVPNELSIDQVLDLPKGSEVRDGDGDLWVNGLEGWYLKSAPDVKDIGSYAPWRLESVPVHTEPAANAGPTPPHYMTGKIEVIDAIEDWGLDKNQCLSNVIKYVARHEHKANPLEDLMKAHDYLTREINKRHGIRSWQKGW